MVVVPLAVPYRTWTAPASLYDEMRSPGAPMMTSAKPSSLISPEVTNAPNSSPTADTPPIPLLFCVK